MSAIRWLQDKPGGPSRDYYRDSDCGRWRITWGDTGVYVLMDKRADFKVALAGSKDECKAEAERHDKDRNAAAA